MTDQVMTALETARAIAAGRTTAVAECEAAIARIEARNPALNAVIVKTYDRARADAAAADARVAAGERSSLLGVPMTVKESYELADTPATWGMTDHAQNIAQADGSTVAKLRAAGAVILGKTNVPPWLADLQSTNPVYGRTVNPHDATRTPGGSSGGSAVALASGMVPLEIGSDIGGSIRTPAHFCGVWGHKPTYAAIPLDGHRFPGTDGADPALSVAGPMARAAEDLSAALDVMTLDPLPPARVKSLDGLRILLFTKHPDAGVSAAIAGGLRDLADRAADAGADVIARQPLLPDLAEIFDAYIPMLNIAISRGLVPGPDGTFASVQTWFQLLDRQARIQRQFAQFFEEVDAILCPVFGTTAFPHDDEPDLRARKLTIDGEETHFADQFAWISMATFAGLPATSFPVGKSEGLPFNGQLITARRRDHDAIAIAGLLAGLKG